MLLLLRKVEDKKSNAVVGRLYLNGQFICYTLENLGKAIPGGCYALENSKSPRFKRELPLVFGDNVASSRGIRMHAGNTVKDSAGCILVGMGVDVNRLALKESKAAEQMVTMLARNCRDLLIGYATT